MEYYLSQPKTPVATMNSDILRSIKEQIVAIRAGYKEFRQEIRELVQSSRTPKSPTPVTAQPKIGLAAPPIVLPHFLGTKPNALGINNSAT